jgi:hypothetical protein
MRRARAFLTALFLLFVVVTPVAAGGKPDRFLEPASPIELPAGVFCDFDVTLTNIVDRGAIFVFPPRDDGSQRLVFNGFIRSTASGNGQELVVNLNSKVTIWLFPDGRVEATFSGPVFAFYTVEEAEVSSLGQGIWYVRGHGGESYGVDGSLQSATAVGNIVDVCAALAD